MYSEPPSPIVNKQFLLLAKIRVLAQNHIVHGNAADRSLPSLLIGLDFAGATNDRFTLFLRSAACAALVNQPLVEKLRRSVLSALETVDEFRISSLGTWLVRL